MITQQQYDELKAERDALAAKNWELGRALGLARSGLVSGSLSQDQLSVINQAFETTPQQSLNEIRAAAIDSVNTDELLKLIKPRGGKECGYEVSDWLENQAAKVRQGGAE